MLSHHIYFGLHGMRSRTVVERRGFHELAPGSRKAGRGCCLLPVCSNAVDVNLRFCKQTLRNKRITGKDLQVLVIAFLRTSFCSINSTFSQLLFSTGNLNICRYNRITIVLSGNLSVKQKKETKGKKPRFRWKQYVAVSCEFFFLCSISRGIELSSGEFEQKQMFDQYAWRTGSSTRPHHTHTGIEQVNIFSGLFQALQNFTFHEKVRLKVKS